MKINPLKEGSYAGEYCIKKVIGMGATSIVYDAYLIDTSGENKFVKLKECYPVRCNIERIDNQVIWKSEEEKFIAFSQFQKAYEISSQIQNATGTSDVTPYHLKIFASNGTKYIVTTPSSGITYDKIDEESIDDAVLVALALTNAVGKYHREGYLHLDIKPMNFLVNSDDTGTGKEITLFDLDSVVSINDLSSGTIHNVSFSKDWAAPEQMQQQIDRICPATDLYSIGAILFERIMRRKVMNSDIGMFSEYHFDERFTADKVNPKSKFLLTNIFKKTLAANVERRYQSAEELSEALKELLDVIRSKSPYLVPNYPIQTIKFVGRENELSELDNALDTKDKVILRGIADIGKTEFIKKYISIYSYKYENIVYMHYTGSIENTINKQLKIVNVNETDSKLDILKEICKENTLLILDNFNVPVNEMGNIMDFINIPCKLIVGTRTDFTEVLSNGVYFMNLDSLTEEDLQKIWENESGKKYETVYHTGDLLFQGYYSTRLWSCLAKLSRKGDYTFKELADISLSGLKEFGKYENVVSTKDGEIEQNTIPEQLIGTINLSKLSDEQKEMLHFVDFVTPIFITYQQINDFFKENDRCNKSKYINALNYLLENNYIQYFEDADNHSSLWVNPVTKEIIKAEQSTTITDYPKIIQFIDIKFSCPKEYLISIAGDECAEDNARYKIECLMDIFSGLDLTNLENVRYMINTLYLTFGDEKKAIQYLSRENSIQLVKWLDPICRNMQLTDEDIAKVKLILNAIDSSETITPQNNKVIYDEKAFNCNLEMVADEIKSVNSGDSLADVLKHIVICADMIPDRNIDIIDQDKYVISDGFDCNVISHLDDAIIMNEFPCRTSIYEQKMTTYDDLVRYSYFTGAILCSALGNVSDAQLYLKKLIDRTKSIFTEISTDILADDMVLKAIDKFHNRSMDEFCLDQLIQYIAFIEQELSLRGEFSETMMYSYYKRILRCADSAKIQLYNQLPAEEKVLIAIFGEMSKSYQDFEELLQDDDSNKYERICKIFRFYYDKTLRISGQEYGLHEYKGLQMKY